MLFKLIVNVKNKGNVHRRLTVFPHRVAATQVVIQGSLTFLQGTFEVRGSLVDVVVDVVFAGYGVFDEREEERQVALGLFPQVGTQLALQSGPRAVGSVLVPESVGRVVLAQERTEARVVPGGTGLDQFGELLADEDAVDGAAQFGERTLADGDAAEAFDEAVLERALARVPLARRAELLRLQRHFLVVEHSSSPGVCEREEGGVELLRLEGHEIRVVSNELIDDVSCLDVRSDSARGKEGEEKAARSNCVALMMIHIHHAHFTINSILDGPVGLSSVDRVGQHEVQQAGLVVREDVFVDSGCFSQSKWNGQYFGLLLGARLLREVPVVAVVDQVVDSEAREKPPGHRDRVLEIAMAFQLLEDGDEGGHRERGWAVGRLLAQRVGIAADVAWVAEFVNVVDRCSRC